LLFPGLFFIPTGRGEKEEKEKREEFRKFISEQRIICI